MGISWQNDINSALTEAVYAVVGKNAAIIEGYVRDEAGDGVGGVTVRLGPLGKHGGVYTVTGGDGFYEATVKPGQYVVYPVARHGHHDHFNPDTLVRTATSGHNTTANFTLLDSLKVTITPTQPSIVADGIAADGLTIRATEDGQPVPGLVVDTWITGASPAETAPVPALLCNGGQTFWPSAAPGVAGAALPDHVTTDSTGTAQLTLRAGTVPGTVNVLAWAEDGFGHLRTKSVANISHQTSVTLTPLPGAGIVWPDANTFETRFEDYVQAHQLQLNTGNAYGLAEQLSSIATAAGFANVAFSPVAKSGTSEQAVLVSPASKPWRLGANGTLSQGPGFVIPFQNLNFALYPSGFQGTAQLHSLPPFPDVVSWQLGSNSTDPWVYSAGSATSTLPGYWVYFGWPHYLPLNACN